MPVLEDFVLPWYIRINECIISSSLFIWFHNRSMDFFLVLREKYQSFSSGRFPFDRFAQLQALSSFCRLSKINIKRIISSLGSTSFVSSQLVSSPTVLRTQVQQMAARVQLSMLTQTQSEIQLINTQMTHNQALNGLSTSIIPDRNPSYWHYYNRQIGFKFHNSMFIQTF